MFENIEFRENEPMKNHTTLHIGGNARWFLLPKNEEELFSIIDYCQRKSIEYFILGGGSNLLVSDEGFDGAVISMARFNKIEKNKNDIIEVQSGVKLFALNLFCAQNELTGLEWSYGIPGTVGGACFMNAGAFGREFCSFVKESKILKKERIITRKSIKYSYRSGFLKEGEVLLSVKIQLKRGNKQEIIDRQNFYFSTRKNNQPYDFFSLGSVFKRRENIIPAKLIDEFGLKGMRKGDICISQKHAGFFLNKGNGRARDFLDLVECVEKLASQKGYSFEREFVMLGFNN